MKQKGENKMDKRFSKKLIEHIFKLLKQKEEDEFVCGNSFVEFTDRKIEIIKPTNVGIVLNKKGKIDHYKVIP